MPKDHPPPKTNSETEHETPFQKFQRLAQKIVSVPKDKIRSPKDKKP